MRIYLTLFILGISTIVLSQGPTAEFSALPLNVCLGEAIEFEDLSSQGSVPIASWAWDFGDGNSSSNQNPTHTYTEPGNYTIILVVTDQNSTADPEVKVNYVTINSLPDADFSTTGDGCTVPFGVTFNNLSPSGANYTYAWDFGNGETSSLESPAIVNYLTAGSFDISLVVTNTSTGCIDTTAQSFVVSDYSANIVGPDSACVGTAVLFNDNSTIGANQWNWNSGSNSNAPDQNPSFTYFLPGTYTVTLTSQNSISGCSADATHEIVILPNPVANFSASPTSGCAPLDVTFSNSSVGGVNYDWDFGDGNVFNGETPPAHTYNSDGIYSVMLEITDEFGCSNTQSFWNMITVEPAVADIDYDVFNGCDPLTVQFSDNSSVPNATEDPIVSWEWDFGDATTYSGETPPAHIFNVGTYDISLTITTSEGCISAVTLIDSIQVGAIDLVDYSHAPIIECVKSDIDFTDLSVISAPHDPSEVTYEWDFGDGGVSSDQNPSYPYPSDTGFFDVQLIVTFRGCKDTLIKTDAVYIKAPLAKFSPAQTLYCNETLPVTVIVTDESIIGQASDDVQMIWRWDDPLVSTTVYDDADLDPDDDGSTMFTYNDYGTYTIKQVIYNTTTGCEDSITQVVSISETIADFTLSADSICNNSSVDLTSTSTSSHTIGSFVFDLGDGQSSSGETINYTYTSAGSYAIELTATNSVGCSHTATYNDFDVLELPLAVISPSAIVGCAPITVDYVNSSTVQGNGFPSLTSFSWTMPDGSNEVTTDISETTSFLGNATGLYTVSLVTTDGFGCVSDPASTGLTITKPSAVFVVDSVVCDAVSFTALNSSFNATDYEWFVDNSAVSSAFNFTGSIDDDNVASSTFESHEIILIATDVNGCKDTLTKDIIVSLPNAKFDYLLSGANVNASGEFTCPPVFSTFTDESESYGDITAYAWDFGDGKSSSQSSPTNTYVFAGVYTASLTITDEFGCTSDSVLVDYLTIGGPSAVGAWTMTGNVCDEQYTFDTTDMVDVDHYSWDLGNNVTANDSTFTYTYLDSGTYDPVFTIYDALGCEVIYPLPSIVINNSGINAAFNASSIENEINVPVNFVDQSTAGTATILQWNWSMGDYSNAEFFNVSDENVDFTYYQPGYYNVTLEVVDALGCSDLHTIEVHVSGDVELPNVFTPNNDGANDLFSMQYDYFDSFDVIILNRWGNVMSEQFGVTGQVIWDGIDMNGNLCTDGVYFYKFVGIMKDGSVLEKDGFLTKL